MHVLLTGATGFIGKVVLATLLRDQELLDLQRVTLLIRPRPGRSARQRFEREIAASPCLSSARANFRERVDVVAGDVTQPELGLSEADAHRLRLETTHVIHVAASVDFDLPLAEAARKNVRSALGVLGFAQSCARLARLVHTSTAYVTPHRRTPIAEELAAPGFDPESTWRDIECGRADERRLLQQSRHPNTYTFTKCLAEQLIAGRRGGVPLSVVRPSIVSAAWRFPLRGWVDSRAAYTGFVALYLLGRLDVILADPDVRLDIVPVDMVAERLVERAARASDAFDVTHAVAGLTRACRVRELEPNARRVKRELPTGARQARLRLRPPGPRFVLDDLLSHRLPLAVGDAVLRWRGDQRGRHTLGALRRAIAELQRSFAHFSHHQYEFLEHSPWPWPSGFEPLDYHCAIVEGVYRYLLRFDAQAVPIGGRAQRLGEGLFSWTRQQPSATPGQRLRNAGLRCALRIGARSVTYDRRSFDAVLAVCASQRGTRLAFVPTFRSRLDSWWCSYLLFDQAELELPLPAIAPARLTEPDAWLERCARAGRPLQFFIEGERSRTREMLPPRLEMLRAIQRGGTPCWIVPIAIAYDRLPEDSTLALDLGQIHLRAGAPSLLEPRGDAAGTASAVAAALQRAMVVSTFHLRVFLASRPELELAVDDLRGLLEARGATVIESSLPAPDHMSPHARRAVEGQFRAWFTEDALRLWPADLLLQRYARDHRHVAFTPSVAPASADSKALATDTQAVEVARALFGGHVAQIGSSRWMQTSYRRVRPTAGNLQSDLVDNGSPDVRGTDSHDVSRPE
jgi:fatty acyl-CoA reductase